MKFTEGLFRDIGYKVALEEFGAERRGAGVASPIRIADARSPSGIRLPMLS